MERPMQILLYLDVLYRFLLFSVMFRRVHIVLGYIGRVILDRGILYTGMYYMGLISCMVALYMGFVIVTFAMHVSKGSG